MKRAEARRDGNQRVLVQKMSSQPSRPLRMRTFEDGLSLDDGVDGRRLDGAREEGPDGAEAQQLDGERQLVQRRPEDLRRHVLVQPEANGNDCHVSVHFLCKN